MKETNSYLGNKDWIVKPMKIGDFMNNSRHYLLQEMIAENILQDNRVRHYYKIHFKETDLYLGNKKQIVKPMKVDNFMNHPCHYPP